MVRPRFEDLHLAEDLALYEPSPEVLKELGAVTLYAVVAPYSSGKDSVVEWLVQHHPNRFAMVVGDTSRQPRPGEEEGVIHHFRTKADMVDDLHTGRFVQVVPGFAGNFYATRPDQYPKDKIGLKPIQARAMADFKKLGLKKLEWLQIVPENYRSWVEWRSLRQYSADDQADRTQEAIESYVKALANPGTHYILNDDIGKAAGRILRLADGRTIPDETKAKQTAVQILEALKRERA